MPHCLTDRTCIGRRLLGLACVVLCWLAGQAAAAVVPVTGAEYQRALGGDLEVHVDRDGALDIAAVRALPDSAFVPSQGAMPNFSFSPHTYWFRLRLAWDARAAGTYLLSQEHPLSDHLVLYRPGPDGRYVAIETGDQFRFAQREVPVRAFGFLLTAKPGVTETYYLSLRGDGALVLDLHLASVGSAQAAGESKHLLFGLYYGALLALLLYNFALWLSLRERVYLYYTLYVAGLGATFFDLNGLAFRYWWPDMPSMNAAFVAFTYLALHALMQFARHFLDLRAHLPRLDRTVWWLLVCNALLCVFVWLLPGRYLFPVTQMVTLAVAVLVFVAGVLAWAGGVRAGRWFTLATGTYILGLVGYALQNFGWLPASLLSNHAVQFGSAIEMAILSLALADRIRHMKAERAAMAAASHRQLLESHQLLEKRVKERNRELVDSLEELSRKHERLIDAQQQLVQAEKMSSLGGLVAGVAHEINNPTNFTRIAAENIAREVARLQDFLHVQAGEDADPALMRELDARFVKLQGQLTLINDGTARLSQIVGDLRLFSRQDGASARIACPDAGLAATLNLVRAQYGKQVDIRLVQHDPTANGTCFPTALNQVFMNLAVNACQAIVGDARLRSRGTPAGMLEVESRVERVGGEPVWVATFRDDGPGIPECDRDHIFEPFFSTKPVGEGTGLGLSVSYGIIQKHHGSIVLETGQGTGACFTLRVPLPSGAV